MFSRQQFLKYAMYAWHAVKVLLITDIWKDFKKAHRSAPDPIDFSYNLTCSKSLKEARIVKINKDTS